jgi:hypothetical protein
MDRKFKYIAGSFHHRGTCIPLLHDLLPPPGTAVIHICSLKKVIKYLLSLKYIFRFPKQMLHIYFYILREEGAGSKLMFEFCTK